MNRATWLQDRRMQKFRDVLSRWERKELSAMEAGELLGCSERHDAIGLALVGPRALLRPGPRSLLSMAKVEHRLAPNGYALPRATVRQRKTGRPVRFELTEQTREAVDDYLKTAGKQPGEFLFIS